MKDKILKIAGVKSEAAFYKKFPTEAAFKKAHGKELKKAQLGASIAPEIGSYTGGQRVSSPANINYNQLYDGIDLSITGMNQQKRMDAQNLATQREIAAKTGKGGGGMQDLIKNLGSAAAAMGKNGKKVKRAQGGLNGVGGGSMSNPNPNPYMWGNPASPGGVGQVSTPVNPDRVNPPLYDQSQMGGQTPNKSPWGDITKGIPVVGKLVGAFQANAAEKKAMKLAEQTSLVSGVSRQAADSRPEQMKRKYVRPEDMAFGTQEMGSAYGTGTNYLSRNGSVIGGNPTQIQNTYAPNNTLYDDLGYEPLEDSDQVKQYRRGGLVYAQDGFMTQASNFMTSPQGGAALNQAGTLAGGNNAGSQFGDAIGDAVKFIPGIGPVASAAIKPIANLVGGLLDRKPKKTAAFNTQTQGNMQNMAFTSGVKGLQGQNQSFMEDGGEMSYAQDGVTSTNWVCPPGYTKYQTSEGHFECLHTNPVPGSSIASKEGLKTIQEDIQYSPNNPDFAPILQASLDESVKAPGAYFKDPKTGRFIVSSASAQYLKKPDLAKTTAQVVTRENGGWMNPEYNPQVIAKFGDHTAQDFYNAGHEGMDSLRAGGHLTNYTPPSEGAMETYAMGGELKTLWGGHAEPISQNPYLPGTGETVMFKGQSHDNGGIGVSYGNKGQDSYTDYAEYGTEAARDNADVEVEGGEPMVELEEGGQIDPATGEAQKAGVVYGNLVLNKQLAEDHGFGKEAGRKMKHIVKDWSKGEAKQNKIIEKSLEIIDNADDSTAFGQLEWASAKAMNQGANMKLKKYADDKRILAGIQGALNDTAAEHGVVADDLARGKIKIDKSNNNMAKFGASLMKAQGGSKIDSSSKWKDFESVAISKLKNIYPGKKVEVRPERGGVYNDFGGRDISTQAGIKAAGNSQTPISLHNFNAAKDYNIYVDGKLVNPDKNKDLYANVLWDSATKTGLYHVGDAENNWDPRHIGLAKEGEGTAFDELHSKYPEIFDNPTSKKSLAWISKHKKDDPEIEKYYNWTTNFKPFGTSEKAQVNAPLSSGQMNALKLPPISDPVFKGYNPPLEPFHPGAYQLEEDAPEPFHPGAYQFTTDKPKVNSKGKPVKQTLKPYTPITFPSMMKPGEISPDMIPGGYDEERAKDARDAAARAAWKVDPRHDSPYMGLEKESKAPWSGRPDSAPINYNPKKTDWTDAAMLAYNEVLPFFRPKYKIDQPDFSSEMMAAGMNQMDPVQAQLFTPNLTQPYDVSFQDQLNANQADYNALQRTTGYNPAAQSALAAQKYAANSNILGGQFRANQETKAKAYEENRKLLDQAQLGNLGILDKQYERQATAKSKTKQQSIEIAKSISDKLAQAKKEQRMSDLEQQRYNFRFDANGRPINMNPLATFNTYGSGSMNRPGGYDLEQGKDFTYNRAGKIVGTRSLGKDESALNGKNGTKVKARNGSIVQAIKNL
jgi:hypothetical protein